MPEQELPQRAGNRNRPRPCRALRRDLALDVVEAALDADAPTREIDVGPRQRAQFAAAEAGVDRRPPQRPVLGRKRFEQGGRLARRGDPVAPAADGR
jgi:hypothetical protein